MIHKLGEIDSVNWNLSSIDTRYAQLAVSYTCKWTSNFKIPTESY